MNLKQSVLTFSLLTTPVIAQNVLEYPVSFIVDKSYMENKGDAEKSFESIIRHSNTLLAQADSSNHQFRLKNKGLLDIVNFDDDSLFCKPLFESLSHYENGDFTVYLTTKSLYYVLEDGEVQRVAGAVKENLNLALIQYNVDLIKGDMMVARPIVHEILHLFGVDHDENDLAKYKEHLMAKDYSYNAVKISSQTKSQLWNNIRKKLNVPHNKHKPDFVR